MDPGGKLGDWRVVRALGRGGMGAVFEVEHAKDGRRAAAKLLTGEVDEATFRRFVREAETGVCVEHPNLVRVVGAGREGGRPFLVMELAAGGSLEQRMKAQGRLPWPVVAAVGAGVARGLAALHAAGFVHRDLKPANILFDAAGTAKVADFGLVRPLDGRTVLTASNLVVGTPAYLSPEQANGRPTTPATDVYGLGCTLHAALTGAPPFRGQGYDVLRRHLQESPPDVREAAPDVPEQLASLVKRCLAKDPAERGSAEDVAARLDALVSRGDVAPERERPRLAARVAVVAGVLVLGAGVWLRTPRLLAPTLDGVARPTSEAATSPPALERPARRRFMGDVMPVTTLVARQDRRQSLVASTLPGDHPNAPHKRWPRQPSVTLGMRAAWGNTDWVHGGNIESAIFLPGGEFFVTGGMPEYNVRLWDLSGRQVKTWGAWGPIRCLALSASTNEVFSADGKGIVAIGFPGTGSSDQVANREAHIPALAVAPSFGDSGIAVWADGVVRQVGLNPARSQAERITPRPGEVSGPYRAAAIAKDVSHALLLGDDGKVTFRHLVRGVAPDIVLGFTGVTGVAVRHDGSLGMVHVGGPAEPGTVHIIELLKPDLPTRTISMEEPVRSVFVSHVDERYGFVTRDAVYVFESGATEPRPIKVPGQSNERAFCGGGRRLLVTSNTGPFRLVDPDGRVRGEPNALGRLLSLAVSDDGRKLATVAESGQITVWEGGDRPRLARYIAGDTPRLATFSRDGGLVAVNGDLFTHFVALDDGPEPPTLGRVRSISLFDRRRHVRVEHGETSPAILHDGDRDVRLAEGALHAEISEDGRHACLVTSSAVTRVALSATPVVEETVRLAAPLAFEVARLDPTWRLLATVAHDRSGPAAGSIVQLWDVATGRRVAEVETPHFHGIVNLAFDPAGQLLATTGYERNIVVWRTRDGAPVASQFLGPNLSDHVTGVAFTANGRLLASSSRGLLLLFDWPR